MVVQVINVNNGDGLTVEQYVELQTPGGGVGGVDACTSQWNAGPEWGARWGGLNATNTCYNLPAPLQAGCNWQYNWLLDVKSVVTYREVTCPQALTDKSGCIRTSA